jgi:HEAT repeat protein
VASLALASTGDERMRPYLRGKLTAPWDEVNLAAARALGMIGSDDGYGVAQRGARSADPRQRAMAALAFGTIGRADAQEELSRLLGDPEEPVRLAAALGILQIHQPGPGGVSAGVGGREAVAGGIDVTP